MGFLPYFRLSFLAMFSQRKVISVLFFFIAMTFTVVSKRVSAKQLNLHRIIVSTDIGGTDPDDYQSMIHLLMYADKFQIEGLLSTGFVGAGKSQLLKLIGLYEKDYPLLLHHSIQFPSAKRLRNVCKQGAITAASYKGFGNSTEGSEWIVQCARKKSSQPLWVLVWGGLEDVAQALHDAPEIADKIRVYWIGGPNKKWGVNAYAYLAANHPNLWMIEANATYRGWFLDAESSPDFKSKAFYQSFIKGRGAMGKEFANHYGGILKMGDTPSLAFLLNGNPNNPEGESWGGSYEKTSRSALHILYHPSNFFDTVPTFAVMEWRFNGPRQSISPDSVCFYLEVNEQQWPGYYLGDGLYVVRYSPKQAEKTTYTTHSLIPALDGLRGSYTSTTPWPGNPGPDDYKLGQNWYTDLSNPIWILEGQQGAKTIARFREAYLSDWAERWSWLASDNKPK